MTDTPVRVAVTGAAGQIGYALLFRIASGALLGPDTPVTCRCSRSRRRVKAAEGTAMELDDCAFPLLAGIDISDDPNRAFDGVNFALLVGARPRTRAWSAATCSRPTAASSSRRARRSTPTPPRTSRCWSSATRPTPTPDRPAATRPTSRRERFTAMMRLDHNRAIAQLAAKAGVDGQRDHQHDRLG